MLERSLTILALVLLLSLSGCRGKPVGRAELRGDGATEARFVASGRPLELWADTNGSWSGSKNGYMMLHYEIDVLAGSKPIGHVTCDTQGTSSFVVCGTHNDIFGEQSGDCELRLDCQLPPLPNGEITLKVVGRKGPNVKKVKDMSINVREN
jgi:hypothetical protein